MAAPAAPHPARGQWLLLLLLAGGVAAFVVIWSQGLVTGERPQPLTFVEGVVGAPRAVNPLLAPLNTPDQDLSSLVFSGLTRLSALGEPIPDLAQAWQISDDGRTYTFYLRPQVRWHDGQPFTASDVVFTYSLLADPQFPGDPALSAFFRQVQCEAIDPLTVRCQLPEPFAPFPAYTTVGILPSHLLQGVRAADLPELSFNRHPIGTGPYRLLSLDEERAVLARHRDYYLGLPRIEQLEVRFFPNVEAALTALLHGEVHGLLVGQNVSPRQLEAVTKTQRFRLLDAPRTPYTALFFNINSPSLADARVRRALSLLIDREAIVRGVLGGRAVASYTPIPPGTWAQDPAIQPQAKDRQAAYGLLREAGWEREKEEPWRKDGQPMSLTLLTDTDLLREAVAREVARHLQKEGILVQVQAVTTAELLSSHLMTRRYDMAIFTIDPGPDPDPYPIWHSSQISPNGRNFSGYFGLEADRILEEGRKNPDRGRRRALYSRFQELFIEDAPAAVLFYPLYTYIVHRSVQGPAPGVLFYASDRFSQVWEWAMEEPTRQPLRSLSSP